MSSSNLDLVRSIFADWERGDYSWVEWADPEIEFVVTDGPSPGVWTGVAGMAEGKAGGLVAGQMRSQGVALYHISAGKVTRLVCYWDRDRALADLGFSPGGDTGDAAD